MSATPPDLEATYRGRCPWWFGWLMVAGGFALGGLFLFGAFLMLLVPSGNRSLPPGVSGGIYGPMIAFGLMGVYHAIKALRNPHELRIGPRGLVVTSQWKRTRIPLNEITRVDPPSKVTKIDPFAALSHTPSVTVFHARGATAFPATLASAEEVQRVVAGFAVNQWHVDPRVLAPALPPEGLDPPPPGYRVMAIFWIVWASVGVSLNGLRFVLGLVLLVAGPDPLGDSTPGFLASAREWEEGAPADYIRSAGFGFLSMITHAVLLAGSIGVLRRKAWGGRLAVLAASALLFLAVVFVVMVVAIMFRTDTTGYTEASRRATLVPMIGGLMLPIFAAIVPVSVLRVLRKGAP